MGDTYSSWQDLEAHERRGVDFDIDVVPHDGASWLIAAPHGGGIEPGTTEIARAIAGSALSFYSVKGLRRSCNSSLHITSHRFHEPDYDRIVAAHPRVLAIHGCNDSERPAGVSVWVGGADVELILAAIGTLSAAGFSACRDRFTPGAEPENLCNRGTTGLGLQFELSDAFRRRCFDDLTRAGRQRDTAALQDFCRAVQTVLAKAA
jgi:phage replication-related protein YjqB (UPF0714/DUF867 family)